MTQVWHLSHESLLVFTFHFPASYVWFEPLSKIHRTHNRIDDGGDNQNNGDDSESC